MSACLTINDNSITIKNSNPDEDMKTASVLLKHTINPLYYSLLQGKTITLTIKRKNNNNGGQHIVLRCNGSYVKRLYVDKTLNVEEILHLNYTLPSEITSLEVWIGCEGSYGGNNKLNMDIYAVKLELGENSTLHMDVPPNPKEEAIRCMLSTADTSDTYANKTLQQSTGDEWDSTYPYVVGDYCIHANQLWLCKVDNSDQVPSEGTYWTATSVSRVLKSLDARLQSLES